MKILSIFISLIVLYSCGGNTPPSSPTISTITKISWNSFTKNDDGSLAQIDGYKVICTNENNVTITGVGTVTEIYLSMLALPNNGQWCCGVIAYNQFSETRMSEKACFLKKYWSFTKSS